jgi:hypothetical protein
MGRQGDRRRPAANRRGDVDALRIDRLFGDGETAAAKKPGQPLPRLALAAGGRVDIDQRSREPDDVDRRSG